MRGANVLRKTNSAPDSVLPSGSVPHEDIGKRQASRSQEEPSLQTPYLLGPDPGLPSFQTVNKNCFQVMPWSIAVFNSIGDRLGAVPGPCQHLVDGHKGRVCDWATWLSSAAHNSSLSTDLTPWVFRSEETGWSIIWAEWKSSESKVTCMVSQEISGSCSGSASTVAHSAPNLEFPIFKWIFLFHQGGALVLLTCNSLGFKVVCLEHFVPTILLDYAGKSDSIFPFSLVSPTPFWLVFGNCDQHSGENFFF